MCDASERRLAIQLAGQLPEEPDEALRVLDLAKTLVREFLSMQPQCAAAVDHGAYPAGYEPGGNVMMLFARRRRE